MTTVALVMLSTKPDDFLFSMKWLHSSCYSDFKNVSVISLTIIKRDHEFLETERENWTIRECSQKALTDFRPPNSRLIVSICIDKFCITKFNFSWKQRI